MSTKINALDISGNSDVAFIIGAEISYDEKLAICPMDMDLGTVLYEQIYRRYRILNNQAYHK